MKQTELAELLKKNGMKATSKRLEVLQFLAKKKRPVSADTITGAFPKVNRVSVYRMLDAMTNANILTRHDLGHGHYDYELSVGKHHHHVVCTSCGEIEDVMLCSAIDDKALKQSKKFERIQQHMVTVFGLCKQCAKKRN